MLISITISVIIYVYQLPYLYSNEEINPKEQFHGGNVLIKIQLPQRRTIGIC
jgi:hypothetical protein